jgi:hypothetical protein
MADLCLICFFFLRNLHTVFPKWLYWLTFPPIVHEHYFFPTSSPTFVVVSVLFFFNCIYIYSYVYTLGHPLYPCCWAEPVPPSCIQFCWRENIRDNKKDIAFLLFWDKDSYTERFLVLLPCTCVLQPTLFHLDDGYSNKSEVES